MGLLYFVLFSGIENIEQDRDQAFDLSGGTALVDSTVGITEVVFSCHVLTSCTLLKLLSDGAVLIIATSVE